MIHGIPHVPSAPHNEKDFLDLPQWEFCNIHCLVIILVSILSLVSSNIFNVRNVFVS